MVRSAFIVSTGDRRSFLARSVVPTYPFRWNSLSPPRSSCRKHPFAHFEGMRMANHTVDAARRGSLKVSGSVPGEPCGRCEIGDLLNRPVCKSGQGVVQVFANRDPEPAAAFNHGDDRGHTRSGLLAAGQTDHSEPPGHSGNERKVRTSSLPSVALFRIERSLLSRIS
jgi:hypothetical protein